MTRGWRVWFTFGFRPGIEVMASSQARLAHLASEGQALSFHFPVSWSYLTAPLGPTKIESRPARQTVPAVVPETPPEPPPAAVLARVPAALEFAAPKPRPADSWEMVIPKTERPVARPSRIAAPPVPAEPVKPHREIQPETKAEAKADDRADVGFSTLASYPRKVASGPSVVVKLALALGLVTVVTGGVVLYTTTSRVPAPAAPAIADTVEVGPSLPVGVSGWISDFAPAGGSQWGRKISILGGSQKLTDFRLEFPGQILSKSLGWVIRAKDPQNFYVIKLEIVKPIPVSEGVLTRFAVIDGQEQPRVHIPLKAPLRPNIDYKIRVDAVGSTFTTWIQGQQVDQWVDPQIREGGVGLYTEAGDRGTIDGEMSVFALLAKSQSKR